MGCGARRCRQCLKSCAVPAPVLLLAFSILVFRNSGLVHSNLPPSTVCCVQEPFQEPHLFPGYVRLLLDGQAGAACVGPVVFVAVLFVGFFFSMETPVGRLQVFVPLAAMPVASLLAAIVGLAHEFPCAGVATALSISPTRCWRVCWAHHVLHKRMRGSSMAFSACESGDVWVCLLFHSRHCCVFRAHPGLHSRQRSSSTVFSVQICRGD